MAKLVFKKQPAKYYRKISTTEKKRLNKIFDKLQADKLNELDVKKLKGEFKGVFRIRVGSLRVFIEKTTENRIEVLYISPRGDAYK